MGSTLLKIVLSKTNINLRTNAVECIQIGFLSQSLKPIYHVTAAMAKSMTQVFNPAVPMVLYDLLEPAELMNVNVSMEVALVTCSTLAYAISDGLVNGVISKVAISRVKTAVKLFSMGLANATAPVQSTRPATTAK